MCASGMESSLQLCNVVVFGLMWGFHQLTQPLIFPFINSATVSKWFWLPLVTAEHLGGVVYFFVRVVWGALSGALYLTLGFFCSANRFLFIWHTFAYWAYLMVGSATFLWYYFFSGSTGVFNPMLGMQKGFALMGLLGILLAWIKLCGDVEKDSKIIIFSLSHFEDMTIDGMSLTASFILFISSSYGAFFSMKLSGCSY